VTQKSFDKIAEGLREAISVAKGESEAHRIHRWTECPACHNWTCRPSDSKCIICDVE